VNLRSVQQRTVPRRRRWRHFRRRRRMTSHAGMITCSTTLHWDTGRPPGFRTTTGAPRSGRRTTIGRPTRRPRLPWRHHAGTTWPVRLTWPTLSRTKG